MEETVILEFKVDQAEAQKSLEQTEKNLIDLKDAQRDLTKEYNKGNITQTQYVRENLKLQNAIKKEQDQKRTLIKTVETESNSRNALRLQISQLTKEYDNLDRSTAKGIKRSAELEKQLESLSAELTKGNKAAGLFKNEIGNYPKQFGEAASQIRVAGVSVGDITAKLASFANPATAAVSILSGLTAAYASSTRGAKDLEFAEDQLSAATTILTNRFAELITISGEDGDGIFSTIVSGLLARFDSATSALAIAQAQSLARLEDLERSEIEIRGDISDRLEENQELLTKISDEQTNINEKLQATNVIEANLVNNRDQLVSILERQRDEIELQLSLDKENETLQTTLLQIEREISKEKAQTTKRIEGNNRLQDDLLKKLREEQELNAKIARAGVRAQTSDDAAILTGSTDINSIPLVQPKSSQEAAVEAQKQFADTLLQVNKDYYQRDLEFKRKAEEIKAEIDRQAFSNAAKLAGDTAELFNEKTGAFKILASAQAIINTYSAATAALAPPPLGAGPIFGPAFAAVAIATGLANVAKINGVEFAEGGYTGDGAKYDVAGVVHKGEYVTPKNVVQSPAAQPHLAALERMRNGYADGGFVTNRSIDTSQQALIMANALRNLPAPVIGVREITQVQNRIFVREKASKI